MFAVFKSASKFIATHNINKQREREGGKWDAHTQTQIWVYKTVCVCVRLIKGSMQFHKYLISLKAQWRLSTFCCCSSHCYCRDWLSFRAYFAGSL